MSSIALVLERTAPQRLPDRALAVLFGLTVFVAATLLFLVQPMAAKGILPIFGGTPAVWTTSMLFFQAALLGGYALAHVTLQRLGPARQSRFQILIFAVALLALPLARPEAVVAGEPVVALLLLLGTGVGLPFLALSTASPVLQRWFSVSGHSKASNAYVLYVASNVGSFVALIAYPFVVEPHLTLDQQRLGWSFLYVILLGLAVVCAVAVFPVMRSRAGAGEWAEPPASSEHTGGSPEPLRALRSIALQRLTWLALAFVPSSLMLGVTTYLTTDIASAPLLWVAPLSLYLLSFVVAFSRFEPVATRAAGLALPFLAVAAAIDMVGSVGLPVALRLPLHLSVFTTAALLCHGRLAASRPPVKRLTEFYLVLAIGGVCGGLINAVVAPTVLDSVAEYPLAIGAALLARTAIRGAPRRRWALGAVAVVLFLAVAALPVLAGYPGAWSTPAIVVVMSLPLLFFSLPVPFGVAATWLLLAGILLARPALHTERNFFGLFRVVETDGVHQLIHGTTLHGIQAWPPEAQPAPSGYYHREGPLGDVFGHRERRDFANVAIVGLGTGGMAAYLESGQTARFYEIDGAVADVAADPRYFTYLASSPAEIDVQIGDGRLLLATEPPSSFQLLIIDAFSSDAIPSHLLTQEAFEMYLDKLAADGLIVVHISNRYLDLSPVIAAAARDLGVDAVWRRDTGDQSGEMAGRRLPSRYVALARDAWMLEGLRAAGWEPLPATDRPAWTDDFSDVVSIIDWRGDLLR